ncbi:asparagine synthase-related protein [Streptomyces sp. NPDC006367]
MGDGHATYDALVRHLWGVPVHAPFLDTTVIDACHAIPGWQRTRPGDFKPLARAAFTGSVPAFLLNRRTKTAFTSSVYAGRWAGCRRPAAPLQIAVGALTAVGLYATRGVLAPLFAPGPAMDRLQQALPSLTVITGAAMAPSLLSAATLATAARIGPNIDSIAELKFLGAAVSNSCPTRP